MKYNLLLLCILLMSFYIIYLIGIHYNFIQDNSHISHFVPNKLGMSIGNSITSPNNLTNPNSALNELLDSYFKLDDIPLDKSLYAYNKNKILTYLNSHSNINNHNRTSERLAILFDENINILNGRVNAQIKDNSSKKYIFTDYLYKNSREIGLILDDIYARYDKYYLHKLTSYVENILSKLEDM
jgi:hypothetical protein